MPKTYGVLKNLWSAASYYHAWNAMIAHPDTAYLDPRSGQISLQQGVRVTDSLAFTFFSSGMGTRLGTETRSSVALLPRHVVSLDTWLDDQYHREPNEDRRHQWALAGLGDGDTVALVRTLELDLSFNSGFSFGTGQVFDPLDTLLE